MNETNKSKETHTKTFTMDAVIVRGPIKFLTDELSQNRLIEGMVVAVMFFEHYGAVRLKQYFSSKGVPIEPLDIDKMKVKTVMRFLQSFGIIDNGIYGEICEVIKVRNDTVHELDYPDSIEEQKLRRMILKAIKCLKVLGAR